MLYCFEYWILFHHRMSRTVHRTRFLQNSQNEKTGAPRPMLREPLRLDIAYPIQWHESRVNLAELAKLRYMHGWSRQELARHYGRTLNAITNYCQSIRRNNFELDGLTVKEKEQIKLAYRN